MILLNMENSCDKLQPHCDSCRSRLFEPYIECAECVNINLCTLCFSKGTEIFSHKNNHSYAVRKNNFHLYENCNWTAKDEYRLLECICEHGYGNWEEIAKSLQTHSKLECQEHYKQFYIDNVQDEDLPKLSVPEDFNIGTVDCPFFFRPSNSDDPPRQINSLATQQLAGYNPLRSEFEMNFDHTAENVLSFQLVENNDSDDDLIKSLQCSLVMAYNNKLRERQRRYNIIRRHGLVTTRKFHRWYQEYEEILTRQVCDRLSVFMQLLSATQFDALIESLSIEKELLFYIHRLHSYRKNGLKTLKAAKLYNNLQAREDRHSKEFKSFVLATDLDWKHLSSDSCSLWKIGEDSNVLLSKETIKSHKKIATPLEIIGMPGYEQLTDQEKALCSSVRVIPANFILFRDQLINENNKIGFLRLLDARRLIKIDVNKTRKIYDYLVSEGFVKKPTS